MTELLLLDNRLGDAGILLAEIETELSTQRATPASAKLLQQTLALRKKLAQPVAVGDR